MVAKQEHLDPLLVMGDLKKSLELITNPEILKKLIDLREALSADQEGNEKKWIEQYKFWLEKNGADCRYAAMVKEFFLKEQAGAIAETINWLHDNWSKFY